MTIFDVNPGSHSAVNVKTSYPWFASMPQDSCIQASFAIGPFPANSKVSTIPSWLHVSLSAPSVAMMYGTSSSVNLQISADSSAPQGAIGSFELLVGYLDPASGESATDVEALTFQAKTSTSAITSVTEECCSVNITSLTLTSPSASGGSSNLKFTISNGGIFPVGYFDAFIINGTVPASGPYPSTQPQNMLYNETIPAGETITISFVVPSSITIQPGSQYTVLLEVWYVFSAGGGPLEGINYPTPVIAVVG